MRGAGGEGAAAALSRADAQDGQGDEHIRDTDKQEGDGQHENAQHVEDGLVHVDHRHVAEEVVDFHEVPTERQVKIKDVSCRDRKMARPTGQATIWMHSFCIMMRV